MLEKIPILFFWEKLHIISNWFIRVTNFQFPECLVFKEKNKRYIFFKRKEMCQAICTQSQKSVRENVCQAICTQSQKSVRKLCVKLYVHYIHKKIRNLKQIYLNIL